MSVFCGWTSWLLSNRLEKILIQPYSHMRPDHTSRLSRVYTVLLLDRAGFGWGPDKRFQTRDLLPDSDAGLHLILLCASQVGLIELDWVADFKLGSYLWPRFRCVSLDLSDQTISKLYLLIRQSCNPKPSDQNVVQPKKLCSATQKTSDQTIVQPKYFVRLWCDSQFCAALVRPTLPLIRPYSKLCPMIRPFLNTSYNPLLFVWSIRLKFIYCSI